MNRCRKFAIYLYFFIINFSFFRQAYAQEPDAVNVQQNQTEIRLEKPFGKIFEISSDRTKITILIDGHERPSLKDIVYAKHGETIIELKIIELTHTSAKAQLLDENAIVIKNDKVFLKKIYQIIEQKKESSANKKNKACMHLGWFTNSVGRGLEAEYSYFPYVDRTIDKQLFKDQISFFVRSDVGPLYTDFKSAYGNSNQLDANYFNIETGIRIFFFEPIIIGHENIGYHNNIVELNQIYFSTGLIFSFFRGQHTWGMLYNRSNKYSFQNIKKFHWGEWAIFWPFYW